MIYLVLTDDWELRGDGSGDIDRIQFDTFSQLTSIYNQYGIKASFNAEVMQQLTFRKLQDQIPQLGKWADKWDSLVKNAYQEGHDIQLHVHPQWSKFHVENDKIQLKGDWPIINYDEEQAYEMFTTCRDYLENLLKPLNPDYKCVSFKSGAWVVAPSDHLMSTLAKLGIGFDMSLVGGLQAHTRNLQFDYRHAEEQVRPYYPDLKDARRVSNNKEPIACVPTHHFYESRWKFLARKIKRTLFKGEQQPQPSTSGQAPQQTERYQEWDVVGSSRLSQIINQCTELALHGRFHISDLAALDYPLMLDMLDLIRKQTKASDTPIPFIISNHTKSIKEFESIRLFAEHISKQSDIQCLTLTELYAGLQSGKFPVRTK